MFTFGAAILFTTWLGILNAQIQLYPEFYYPNGTCKNLMREIKGVPDEAVNIRIDSFSITCILNLAVSGVLVSSICNPKCHRSGQKLCFLQ
jgi:hypothetical protein